MLIATENASRRYIPLEKYCSGVSTNSCDLGELDDVVEALERDRPRNAVDGGIHEDVLARRRFVIETGAKLQQRDHTSRAR